MKTKWVVLPITLLLSHLFPVKLWVLAPRTVTEERLRIWAWAQEVHVEIINLWQRPSRSCTGDLALGWTPEMVQSPFSSQPRKIWKNGWHTNLSLILSSSALWNVLLGTLHGRRAWIAVGFVWPPLPLLPTLSLHPTPRHCLHPWPTLSLGNSSEWPHSLRSRGWMWPSCTTVTEFRDRHKIVTQVWRLNKAWHFCWHH